MCTSLSEDGAEWLICALDPFHDTNHRLAGYPDLSGDMSVVMDITKTVTFTIPATTTPSTSVKVGSALVLLCPYTTNASSNTVSASTESPGLFVPGSSDNWWDLDLGLFGYNLATNLPYGSGAQAKQPSTFQVNLIGGIGPAFTKQGNPFQGLAGGGLVVSSKVDGGGNIIPLVSGSGGTVNGVPVLADPVSCSLQPGLSPYPHRIIGAAFEVHNVTAPLNKQGTITVFSSPANLYRQDFMTEAWADPVAAPTIEINAANSSPYSSYSSLPRDAGTALLMGDARQWDAAEGCYCVAKFNDMENPAVNPLGTFGLGARVSQGLYTSTPAPGITSGKQAMWNMTGNVNTYPMDFVGCYIDGSFGNVYTVTVKWIVEVFPTPTTGTNNTVTTNIASTLTPLASPSCAYDPIAIELYARTARHLPAGVKVSENFIGGFFQGVSGLLGAAAKSIAPVVPALATTASAGAKAVYEAIKPSITNFLQSRLARTIMGPYATRVGGALTAGVGTAGGTLAIADAIRNDDSYVADAVGQMSTNKMSFGPSATTGSMAIVPQMQRPFQPNIQYLPVQPGYGYAQPRRRRRRRGQLALVRSMQQMGLTQRVAPRRRRRQRRVGGMSNSELAVLRAALI